MVVNLSDFLKKLEKKKSKGQAIIEFIIFVPFIVILYLMILNHGSAINGAINQQKVLRSYFYSRVKHDSMIPKKSYFVQTEVNTIGFYALGWAEKLVGDGIPYTTCYKVPSFFTDSDSVADCDDETVDQEQTTIHIKPQTFYGVCSATYRKSENGILPLDQQVSFCSME